MMMIDPQVTREVKVNIMIDPKVTTERNATATVQIPHRLALIVANMEFVTLPATAEGRHLPAPRPLLRPLSSAKNPSLSSTIQNFASARANGSLSNGGR